MAAIRGNLPKTCPFLRHQYGVGRYGPCSCSLELCRCSWKADLNSATLCLHRFSVIPCSISAASIRTTVCRNLLLVLQGFEGFVVFNLRISPGFVGSGFQQSRLRFPFLNLRIKLFFMRFRCSCMQTSPRFKRCAACQLFVFPESAMQCRSPAQPLPQEEAAEMFSSSPTSPEWDRYQGLFP